MNWRRRAPGAPQWTLAVPAQRHLRSRAPPSARVVVHVLAGGLIRRPATGSPAGPPRSRPAAAPGRSSGPRCRRPAAGRRRCRPARSRPEHPERPGADRAPRARPRPRRLGADQVRDDRRRHGGVRRRIWAPQTVARTRTPTARAPRSPTERGRVGDGLGSAPSETSSPASAPSSTCAPASGACAITRPAVTSSLYARAALRRGPRPPARPPRRPPAARRRPAR